MNKPAGWAEEARVPFISTTTGSLRDDLTLLLLLGVLGVAAAYLNVRIPHTDVFIEARYAFGFMGFALIRRLWVAMLLACLLAAGGPHQLPLLLVFTGNMLYAIPCLAVIRAVHWHVLSRRRSLWLFGVGWLLLVLFCYQAFNTPVLWALLAVMRDAPVWPAVIGGWREQPFLIESFIVAIISASGMVALRSHENLRRSQHELAITLDSIGDGVIAADARGRVTRMNPVAQSLTGWSLEAARGKPLEEVFCILNTQTREPVENPMKRVLREGRVVGLANHTCLVARDGTEYQIADCAAPLKEADGRMIGAVMVFRDVTIEYKTRESLMESEHRFRSFVENANDIVYALTPEGVFTYISPNWLEFMGEPADEAIGRSFESYVHPEDVPLCLDFLQKILKTGERHKSVAYRAITKKGAVTWHTSKGSPLRNENGDIIGYVGIARDVTEQKHFEEVLKQRTEELEVAQQLARMGSWTFHPETEGITWSQEMYRIFGCDPASGPLSYDEHLEILHPEDRDWCVDTLERSLSRGEDYDIQFRIISPDGETKHIRTLARVEFEGEGSITRVFGATQDITDHIRLNEEKAKLEAQFHQSQKLESVGRLAGGVAHDLNNLLAPILGYAEMLLEDFGEDDARRASVEEIVGSGLRARDLVRQLLAFSRKQVLAFKAVDLNDVLERFEKLLRRTIREDVALKIAQAPSLPFVRADIGQVEQVIMNLAVNAQDAMPDGGELTIETAAIELDAAYTAERPGVTPGSYVMLSVSDTGRGMDAETQARVFEPFFTTKAQGKGTGLGLATVYGIVKQHGGNVWVYSEPGRGTTFKVYWPASEDAQAPAETPAPRKRDLRGAETILLVEDNEQVRGLTEVILERQGYRVLAAENGEEALSAVDRHDGRIDLLLTDVVMPGMSGKDLFDRVAARFPHMKILYMSGYTDNIIAHRGVMDEGVNFIQKPFAVKALASKVRDVLDNT